MQLLADLVRSLPGIGTRERALDAMNMGLQIKNQYRITCHERFHANGSRCDVPEDSCYLWHHVSPKWTMDFHNLVVTVGRNELLDRTFTAVGANVNWYVGLVGAGAGTVAITSGAASVTGTSTTFDAALDDSPIADIVIVGAGAAGADLITTVATRTSNTAITTTANAGTTVSGAAYATEAVPADTLASHINSWSDTAPYSNATRPAWTRNGAASAGAMSNSSSKASFTINTTGRAFGAFLVTDNTKSGTAGSLYGVGIDVTNGSRAVQNGDSLNVQIDLSVTAS